MKTLVVVQARTSSTRLPNKVLLPVAGAPMLARMIERLSFAEAEFDLTIATTHDPADDSIVAIAQRAGAGCFRGHPTDCLDRHYRAAVEARADRVVKIPSDCPLVDPKIVDRVLAAASPEHDYVSNLHPQSYPDGNDVEVMTMNALETAHREATKPFEREHTTPFLWDRPERFRLANVAWERGIDLSMSHRFTVDYREDYELVREVFEALYDRDRAFGLDDILSFLDANPKVRALNARYCGVNWYRRHLGELRTIGATETRVPDEERAS